MNTEMNSETSVCRNCHWQEW